MENKMKTNKTHYSEDVRRQAKKIRNEHLCRRLFEVRRGERKEDGGEEMERRRKI